MDGAAQFLTFWPTDAVLRAGAEAAIGVAVLAWWLTRRGGRSGWRIAGAVCALAWAFEPIVLLLGVGIARTTHDVPELLVRVLAHQSLIDWIRIGGAAGVVLSLVANHRGPDRPTARSADPA